jgi:hypothetical protein
MGLRFRYPDREPAAADNSVIDPRSDGKKEI